MIGPIVLQIVLILLNATFASAEIAVISMNETKLRVMAEEGNKKARHLYTLTEQPARFLATIQVAITLAGLLGSAFAAESFSGPLAKWIVGLGVEIPENVIKSVSLVLITLVLAYFNLVFGELVPKRIAMKKSEQLALALSGLLYGVSKVFAPLVFLLTGSTNGILKLMGINPEEEEEQVTEEEIRMMVDAGSEKGTIDTDEKEMIQNVFEFDDISADEICTHRSDVVVLDADDSLEEWKESIFKNRHSYYPVYKDSKENIVGILDTKDYFRLEEVTKESIFEKAVEPAFFIPENIKAAKLFERMKQTRNYFAVLLDEYGEMSGIVTLHDLVEALVGDLYEENEDVTEKIQKLAPNIWRIRGDAEIDDVVEQLKITLPEEQDDFDTFNGLIYSIIDRIPEDGSQFVCDAYGMRIHVKSVEKHKIVEAVVELMGDENSPMKEEKSEK